MRLLAVLPILLLAACSGGSSNEPRLATEPTVHLAESALAGGNAEFALRISEGILSRQPGNVDALVVRGEAQTALGQKMQAAANFQRALQLSSTSYRALVGLGRLRLESDPAAAETLFQRALGYDPRNIPALNNLGISRDLQNRHADAQDAYRKALALSPNNSATLVNLGLSLALSGKKQDALRVLRPLASDPVAANGVRQNLATALSAAGDTAGAATVRGAGAVQNTDAGQFAQ